MKDSIVPFTILDGKAKGRIIRISGIIKELQSRREYPIPVAKEIAKAMILTGLLGDNMKDSGVLTLQVQGDGNLTLLVTDIRNSRFIRAYAKYSNDDVPSYGKGHLAITIDHELDENRYQGIVELKDDDLALSAYNYFKNSEQIDSVIMLVTDDIARTAAGFLLQRMPDCSDDEWDDASIIATSLKREELLDSELSMEDVLFRLFHLHKVTSYKEKSLEFECTCSLDRVSRMIHSMKEDEQAELKKLGNGKIEVTCEFCGKVYEVK